MTFLAPALLALGAAVAVPLVLHLLHRHRAPRVPFPAIRYLRRAEQEHATRIRIRQLLLLALRVLAMLLLAGAAARPFLVGDRGAHAPTAVALVLDNSLSSGAVVGTRRVLDELKDAARVTLSEAAPDDVFWLLRAGAPWEPAIRGTAEEVSRAVEATAPTVAAGDLNAALDRARGILLGAGAHAREIHLLSDLQATAFETAVGGDLNAASMGDAGDVPIRVLAPARGPVPNRSVRAVVVGGGLAPRAGERSPVTASIAGSGDTVGVRLALEGTVRGVARAPVDEAVVLSFPARPAGRVTGYVEIDPDALVADDRRWFVVDVRPPPAVSAPPSQPFLDEALDVLADAGRIRRGDDRADVVIAPAGIGAEAVRDGAAVLLLPPATPLERTAANRRLAEAGVPWRLEAPTAGARIDTSGLDLPVLADVRFQQVYGLTRVPDSEGAGSAVQDTVLVRLRSGAPWAVGRIEGDTRYVLLATPLTPEAGTVPTSAAMLPLLDRALNAWLALGGETVGHVPGDEVTVAGDAVVRPDGGVDTVAAGALYRLTEAGIYRFTAEGREIGAVAVNPPAAESELARLDPAELTGPVRVAALEAWPDVIYHRRLGREMTVALLVAALAVLLLESAVAATGRA